MNPFMALAFQEAQEGIDRGEGGPFGAVIVKDGEVVASGHNEVLKTNDPTAHAEMVTIRKASAKLNAFHLQGCILYVTGEPCPMCFSAIHWAHLDAVYYVTTKKEAAAIGFDDTLITEIILGKHRETIPFVHTPHTEGQKLLNRWRSSLKHRLY